jgi:hypothetical protein
LPGCHSSFTNLNGPEPIGSFTCSSGGVAASRAGMMNGTLLDGLPSASSTMPNGSFSSSTKLFLSVACSLPVAASISLPSGSFLPQRSSEATQSSAVTGAPSWKRRPSRRVNAYFMASRLTV